ncbi:MAG: antiterminator Q family protein [Dehalobacterium sp.]
MDENLLILLKGNPEKGLEKLMNIYMGLVYTIVYGKLSSICSKEDIEECVSTVFYEVYQNKHNIDLEKGSIKAFLSVIAKRKAIDIYRKHEKIVNRVVSMDDLSYGIINAQSTKRETSDDDGEIKAVLIDSIKALGKPDSEIFIRKYYLGQSTKIIAKILDIKENTIDKKVSRGLAKLKEALEGVL